MTFNKPVTEQETDLSARAPQVDPTVAVLVAVQHHLEEQTKLLQKMNAELATFRAAQTTHTETLARIDRRLRWAVWGRRIRTVIAGVFWLGVAGLLTYYWTDLATIWNDLARFIL
jgi:transcriptional regulator GlxA family with amidase domain